MHHGIEGLPENLEGGFRLHGLWCPLQSSKKKTGEKCKNRDLDGSCM